MKPAPIKRDLDVVDLTCEDNILAIANPDIVDLGFDLNSSSSVKESGIIRISCHQINGVQGVTCFGIRRCSIRRDTRALDLVCSLFSSELHEKSAYYSSQKVFPETYYSITRNDWSSPLVKSENITNSGTKSTGSQTSMMVRQPFKPRTNEPVFLVSEEEVRQSVRRRLLRGTYSDIIIY